MNVEIAQVVLRDAKAPLWMAVPSVLPIVRDFCRQRCRFATSLIGGLGGAAWAGTGVE